MEMAMIRMDGKGRVVIPKRLREQLGMAANEVLFAYTFESLLFIRKVSADKKSVIESVEKLGLAAPAPLQ